MKVLYFRFRPIGLLVVRKPHIQLAAFFLGQGFEYLNRSFQGEVGFDHHSLVTGVQRLSQNTPPVYFENHGKIDRDSLVFPAIFSHHSPHCHRLFCLASLLYFLGPS